MDFIYFQISDILNIFQSMKISFNNIATIDEMFEICNKLTHENQEFNIFEKTRAVNDNHKISQ